MAYGLRCWDDHGNLTLDVSDRLTRMVEFKYINVLNSSITIPVTLPGTIFAVMSLDQDARAEIAYAGNPQATRIGRDITIDQSNRTITVKDSKGYLVYGVY